MIHGGTVINPSDLTDVKNRDGVVDGVIAQQRHPDLPYLERGARVLLFDGVNQALHYVQKYLPDARHDKSSSDPGRDNGFYFFNSYEKAMDTFLKDPESVVKFDPTSINARDPHEAGSLVEYDVTGDYIDMGRYLEGIPEAFGTMHNGNARNRRATIFVNGGMAFYFNQTALNLKAERIMRLVDALENNGVRCHVKHVISDQCGHFETTIKQHGESLTITDLAVALHSDYKRRINFRMKEHSDTWQDGYGMPDSLEDRLTPAMLEPDTLEEMTIYIGSNIEEGNLPLRFDAAEKLIEWELSKPNPELSAMLLKNSSFSFSGNGTRPSDEIIREGQAWIRDYDK